MAMCIYPPGFLRRDYMTEIPPASPYVFKARTGTIERRSRRHRVAQCKCSLDLEALFLSPIDVPSPPLPLSNCEYHELLRSLPHRLQNYPWKLCYDTARDGFSLPHFYRVMRDVHDTQGHGLGLFVVASRDGKSEGHSREVDSGGSVNGTFSSSSPASHITCDSPCSWATANGEHEQHLLPDGWGVIGCFTPEVPSLSHQLPHSFFGSSETYVFRVHRQSEWYRSRIVKRLRRKLSASHSSLHKLDVPSMGTVEPATQQHNYLSEDATRTAVPIISKYTWAGSSDNRQFLSCHQNFFCVGGGRDGAALFIDKNLQFGTSSATCRTFDSPSLFGTAKGGLPHSEFVILRMVWFSVTACRSTLRMMVFPERHSRCNCVRQRASGRQRYDHDGSNMQRCPRESSEALGPTVLRSTRKERSVEVVMHRCDCAGISL